MKYIALFALILAFSAFADTFDESVNYQPGLDLYSEEATLTDLIGHSGNQLCAPSSLTHMFYFLKYAHQPNYSQLASIPDMDNDGTANTFRDQIRYFFNICSTDRETGTLYQTALECMKSYVVNSGYTPWAWMIGAHSKDGNNTLTSVTPDLLRYYLRGQVGMIMMVGWYKTNQNGQYERTGGHFFNIYGYDYNAVWGAEKIILKSVNSWINYAGRDRSQIYTDITMSKINSGFANIDYEVAGPGLEFPGYKAFVDDILIVLPVAQ